VGLGIVFYDFIHIGEPYLYPGAGSSIQIVKFRLVVFRPSVGETIVGKVIQSNKDGVRVSLEFFDDILIPASQLQNPSAFNPSTNLWVWKYDTDGDSTNEFPLTIGEEVKPTKTIAKLYR
jgi:DNA-directed RNA polymerase III subunit RPC8